MNAMPQKISFAQVPQIEGLDGCSGVARLGLCIRCDRLYRAGRQISPAAVRGPRGAYECEELVINGVAVTPSNEGKEST